MKKVLLISLLCTILFAKDPIAIIDTNMGIIKVELKPQLAPKAVENFVTHSKNGYYNNQIFHRVIKNFMIQGGDPTGTGTGGESIWEKDFEDEFSSKAIFDKPFILAMANRGANTNGSQFFITTTATYWLNGYHTIFGYVVDGFDVVRGIENVKTNGRYGGDKPISDVKINSIKIEE
ncbi:peptidylprolyl isomerase [Aliarcobacter skirrowii]|uniref:peptidylprolyl isomerase n=1 Tax=Aliarcobacter skirrowii TaxID=28200 RepID=UPI0029B9CF87|nr:peptidylprolyl isomerase [Aliarcobacter skirrowii]MDX4012917.1 peptidylprolyl isomerase [Aliarcobacter skirrowii]